MMMDLKSADQPDVEDDLAMVGLRPGWNDEGYYFHPESEKGDAPTDNRKRSTAFLLVLAHHAARNNVIPPNDLDTKISVVSGFKFYESFGLREVARIERNFHALPSYDRSLLPFSVDKYIQMLKESLRANQNFLDDVSGEFTDALNEALFQTTHKDPDDTDDVHYARCADDVKRHLHDAIYEMSQDHFLVTMSSARSTVKQFVRDWSDIGKIERDQAYIPLLNALEKYMPERRDEEGRLKRVLCPGSGLGRLPFEVLCRGYGSQGNEYAHSMLMASDWILNHMIPTLSMKMFPYTLQGNNRRTRNQVFTTACVPDISPAEAFQNTILDKFPDFGDYPEGYVFSMTEGEFVEAYDSEVDQWDAVLASFFLDTAQNIIQYLKTIARILKPGGIFVSNGPLLYHYAESDNKPSIELSYEDIRAIMCTWFDVLEEDEIEACYTANGESLMKTQYTTKFFALRRTDAKNPPKCEASVFNPAVDSPREGRTDDEDGSH